MSQPTNDPENLPPFPVPEMEQSQGPDEKMEALEAVAETILAKTGANTVMMLVQWDDDARHVTSVREDVLPNQIVNGALRAMDGARNVVAEVMNRIVAVPRPAQDEEEKETEEADG